MATILITTELIAVGEYEFTQTLTVGEVNVDEKIYTEKHDDRMFAAMTNLGYACRWFYDLNIRRGCVCILTDIDGQDYRYNKEHDDLFRAIRSQHDYANNRKKYEIFYGKYVRFLDRIRELANEQEITFSRNFEVKADNKIQQVEIFNSDSPFLIRNQNWNENNILKLSMIGTQNKVECRACQAFIIYQQSDNFIPVKVPSGNKNVITGKILRTNKAYVKWFLDQHLELHRPI